MLNCIEQLRKMCLRVHPEVPAPAEDLGEEVTVLAIVHNDVSEIFALDNTMEGGDIGVSGGKLMEPDLAQAQLASMG